MTESDEAGKHTSLAAFPLAAADEAAAARERQLDKALSVAVRRVPVQSDCTTWRLR